MPKSKKRPPQGNVASIWVPLALMAWGMTLLAAGWGEDQGHPARAPFLLVGGIWVALGLTKIVDSQIERIRRLGRGGDIAAALIIILLIIAFCWFWWGSKGQ